MKKQHNKKSKDDKGDAKSVSDTASDSGKSSSKGKKNVPKKESYVQKKLEENKAMKASDLKVEPKEADEQKKGDKVGEDKEMDKIEKKEEKKDEVPVESAPIPTTKALALPEESQRPSDEVVKPPTFDPNKLNSGVASIANALDPVISAIEFKPVSLTQTDKFPEVLLAPELTWNKNAIRCKRLLELPAGSNPYEGHDNLFDFYIKVFNIFNKRYVAPEHKENLKFPTKMYCPTVGIDLTSWSSEQTLTQPLRTTILANYDALGNNLQLNNPLLTPYFKRGSGMLSDFSYELYSDFMQFSRLPVAPINQFIDYLRLTEQSTLEGVESYAPVSGVDAALMRLALPENPGQFRLALISNTFIMHRVMNDLTKAFLQKALVTASIASEDDFSSNIAEKLTLKTTEISAIDGFVPTVRASSARNAFIDISEAIFTPDTLQLFVRVDHSKFSLGDLLASMLYPLLIPSYAIDPDSSRSMRNYFLRWGLYSIARAAGFQPLLNALQSDISNVFDYMEQMFNGNVPNVLQTAFDYFGRFSYQSSPEDGVANVNPVILPAQTVPFTNPRVNGVHFVPFAGQLLPTDGVATVKWNQFVALCNTLGLNNSLNHISSISVRKMLVQFFDLLKSKRRDYSNFVMYMDNLMRMYMPLSIFHPRTHQRQRATVAAVSPAGRQLRPLSTSSIYSLFLLASMSSTSRIPFDSNLFSMSYSIDQAVCDLNVCYDFAVTHYRIPQAHANWTNSYIVDKAFSLYSGCGLNDHSLIKWMNGILTSTPYKYMYQFGAVRANSVFDAKMTSVKQHVDATDKRLFGLLEEFTYNPSLRNYVTNSAANAGSGIGWRRIFMINTPQNPQTLNYNDTLTNIQAGTISNFFLRTRDINQNAGLANQIIRFNIPVNYDFKFLEHNEEPVDETPIEITLLGAAIKKKIVVSAEYVNKYFDPNIMANVYMKNPVWQVDYVNVELLPEMFRETDMATRFPLRNFVVERECISYMTPTDFKRVMISTR